MPDLYEGLIQGESPAETQALYDDVLHRLIRGSADFAFDRFVAWEITKDLQRIRRLGSHAAAEDMVNRLTNRVEQRAAEWDEVDHRTRSRRQVLASIQATLDLYRCLVPGREAAKLRVVG